MPPLIDLKGRKYGRLTVVERGENDKTNRTQWWCKCDCGNPELILVRGGTLKRGDTLSCGCYKRERTKEALKKYNKYDLSGEYGIGWTSNTNKEFYFDLEDYDKIKIYCWQEDSYGHIKNYVGKYVYMHRLIMGLTEEENNLVIDHIDNTKPYDNRKQNLRITTPHHNSMNKGLYKNNSSGVTGVDWVKSIGKWRVRIKFNRKEINGGYYEDLEDAKKKRIELENLYFGDYGYHKSQQIIKEVQKDVC